MLLGKLPFAAVFASRFLPFFNRAFQPSSGRKADGIKPPWHTGCPGGRDGAIARRTKLVGRG
jgi:hypothetical protein